MNWDFSILKELNESNFSTISNGFIESFVVHFDSGIIIVENGFINQVNNVIEKFTVEEGVLS